MALSAPQKFPSLRAKEPSHSCRRVAYTFHPVKIADHYCILDVPFADSALRCSQIFGPILEM
jgi:hypothetical protein